MENRLLKMSKHADDFHRETPEFNNLEIRGTWSGNVDEPMDLLISLEIQSIPSTQLHLLNLRPPYISLVRTSIRCLSDESRESENESPSRSPLFAFSTSVSDDGDGNEEEDSVYSDCSGENVHSGLSDIPEEEESMEELEPEPEPGLLDGEGGLDAESLVSVPLPKVSSTGRSVSAAGLSELGLVAYTEDRAGGSEEQTAEKDQESGQQECPDSETLALFQLSPLSDDPPELPCEESAVSQNLGKRTASDACLSDPEQDTEEKRMHRMSASRNTSQGTSSGSVCSIDIGLAEEKTRTGHSGDSIDKDRRSLILRRVKSMSQPLSEQQQHSEADNPHQKEGETEGASQENEESTDSIDKSTSDTLVSEAVVEGNVGAQLLVEELDTQSKIASDELLVSSDTDEDDDYGPDSPIPVKPTNPVMPLTPTSLTDTVLHYDSVTNHAKTTIDVGVLETPKAASDDLLMIPDTGGTTEIDEDDDPGSPTPVRPTRLIIPTTPVIEDTASPAVPSSTDIAYPESEPSQHLTSEPELDWNDGILLVSNPPQANSETYRIAITVSVYLQKGKLQGWDELVVPGLPRMRNGESGFFLFQMPENRGMEFRTTSFCRHRFVEDCFFAEFTNSGDLVIPLRICGLGSYGILKDFTVEQEIIADHDVSNNKVSVAYNAICSLKLPNRCFWAEKCCFFLDVDGGPEGFYECVLDQPCTGFPIIYLAATDRPTGVAHVQVTCSRKILEMFCVTWDVKDLSRPETKWQPRVHPGSAGVNGQERHFLRQKFIDLLSVDDYEVVEADDDTTGEPSDRPEVSVHVAFADDDALQDKKPDDIPGERRLSKQLVSLKQLVAIVVMVAFFILFGLARLNLNFLSLGSTDNATREDVGRFVGSEIELNYTTNEDYHLAYYTNNNQSREGNLDTTGILDIDYGSSEYETIEGEEVLELEAIIEELEDVEPAEEPDEPEAGVEPSLSATQLSFRDKVDYLLGWKGPTDRSRDEKMS